MRAPRPQEAAAALCLGLALAAGRAAAVEALAVDPADPRLAARPDLVERLTATAHGYFRFVNAAFAGETCRLFSDVAASMPEVNLHGDAHVEQYAVTSIGRGLTDFDDCTRGKAVIDLVRFGSSLLLAARERGWTAEERRLVDAFLSGYRTGLGGGRREMRTPDLVTRSRVGFKWDHAAALRQALELVERAPLPVDAFADGASRFAELVSFVRELPPAFFRVKRLGALTMGVGSALDEKYLLILEGDTPAAEDDLVVEAKQIRDLAGNPCVRTDVGASRVLDGQRLIAYEPFAYAAVVPHGGKFFWMHDWTDDYREASIATAIRSARDLREIAFDAGVQMGRAHPKRPDGVQDKERRKAAARSLDAIEPRVRAAMRDMAARTESAWRAFREKAGRATATDSKGTE
ncbi:MAG TPA: DUF2252 family protein [Vicinamibacteria bacterium]|nr:DUF2252 family protein [Vicinamibacteria bacterium]